MSCFICIYWLYMTNFSPYLPAFWLCFSRNTAFQTPYDECDCRLEKNPNGYLLVYV